MKNWYIWICAVISKAIIYLLFPCSGCWFAYYRKGGCLEYDRVKVPGGKMHYDDRSECDQACENM